MNKKTLTIVIVLALVCLEILPAFAMRDSGEEISEERDETLSLSTEIEARTEIEATDEAVKSELKVIEEVREPEIEAEVGVEVVEEVVEAVRPGGGGAGGSVKIESKMLDFRFPTPLAKDSGQPVELDLSRDVKNLPVSDVRIAPEAGSNTIRVKESKREMHPLSRVTIEELSKSAGERAGFIERESRGKLRLSSLIRSGLSRLFGVETAYAADLIPIIEYYDGMEDNFVDYALYSLVARQNPDGSFGKSSRYEVTGDIALLLAAWNLTNNDQFALALDYLKTYEPTNIRDKAIKARLMYGLNEPYQYLLDEIIAGQNEDHGFGYLPGYASDMQTTLEVMLALWAANYSLDQALPWSMLYVGGQIGADGAVKYTIDGDPSYYLVNKTARYLEPMKSLVLSGDGQDSFTVQGKINALLGYLDSHTDPVTGKLYGSDNSVDIAMTLRTFDQYNVYPEKIELLKELVLTYGIGESLYAVVPAMQALARPDIKFLSVTPVGTFYNNGDVSFEMTLKNTGYAPSDQLTLYAFVDGLKLNAEILLPDFGFYLEPGETKTIEYAFDSTYLLIDDTSFAWYIEDVDESIVAEDNWIETNAVINPNQTGAPSIPLFFSAFKSTSGGAPSIEFFWSNKPDPNRCGFYILIKPAGAADWQGVVIDASANHANIKGVAEGVTYDVSFASLTSACNQYMSNFDTVQITTGANPVDYTGDLQGFVTVDDVPTEDVVLAGYTQGAISGVNGEFQKNSLPNGYHVVQVLDDPYKSFLKRYSISSGQTTDVGRVFTTLKDDTESPSGLSIEIMELVASGSDSFDNGQSVTIVAEGQDNVALKSADFYYYDPGYDVWLFIGEQAVESGQAVIEWFVPESVSGTGFKVRSMFWDYQGNYSEPVDSSLFNIIDTSVPVDSDGDGIVDDNDNCQFKPNADQSDIDQDEIGDVCDQPGDVTGDGITNVADVQCTILTALWDIGGKTDPVPVCLQNGNILVADLDCDEQASILDVLLDIEFALDLNCNAATGTCPSVLDPGIDADGDNIVDACM